MASNIILYTDHNLVCSVDQKHGGNGILDPVIVEVLSSTTTSEVHITVKLNSEPIARTNAHGKYNLRHTKVPRRNKNRGSKLQVEPLDDQELVDIQLQSELEQSLLQ